MQTCSRPLQPISSENPSALHNSHMGRSLSTYCAYRAIIYLSLQTVGADLGGKPILRKGKRECQKPGRSTQLKNRRSIGSGLGLELLQQLRAQTSGQGPWLDKTVICQQPVSNKTTFSKRYSSLLLPFCWCCWTQPFFKPHLRANHPWLCNPCLLQNETNMHMLLLPIWISFLIFSDLKGRYRVSLHCQQSSFSTPPMSWVYMNMKPHSLYKEQNYGG